MSSPETNRSNASFGATRGRGDPLPKPVDKDTRPRNQPSVKPASAQDPAVRSGVRRGGRKR